MPSWWRNNMCVPPSRSSLSHFSWIAVYWMAKIKLLTNDGDDFDNRGQWVCEIKYWILYMIKQTSCNLNFGIFLWRTREVWLYTVVFFLLERCPLLLCTDFYDLHEAIDPEKVLKWHRLEVHLLAQSWKNLITNWTYSCAFCSKKVYRATSSCGLTTIPAVCSTLVMCFLCPSLLFPSSRHKTWYSLAPKNYTHSLHLMS